MNFFFNNNELSRNSVKQFAERYYTSPTTEDTDPVSAYCKAVCRSQLEIWALASRRVRSTLAFPSQLAASRSPDAVLGAYADFWKTAFTEYADTTHRISELFSQPGHSEAARTAEKQPQVVAELSKPARAIKLNGSRHEPIEEYRQAS